MNSNRWHATRAIASEWSHDPTRGSLIETYNQRTGGIGPCSKSRTSHVAFSDTLLRSVFSFAPGGGGPYSFRLLESLAAGSIPVVPEDHILPFEGWAIPRPLWDRCSIKVSLGETYALPDLLTSIAPKTSVGSFVHRHMACRRIWRTILQSPRSAMQLEQVVHRLFWKEVYRRVGR